MIMTQMQMLRRMRCNGSLIFKVREDNDQLFNNYSMEYALIVTVGSIVIREQQGLPTIISFRFSIISWNMRDCHSVSLLGSNKDYPSLSSLILL